MSARPGETVNTVIVHRALIAPQADAPHIMTVTLDDVWQGTFKRRKSWPLKKYVDEALRLSNSTPAYEFTYAWDLT